MNWIRPFLAALALAALTACAALGSPTPQTFNQKVAVAVATVTETRNTAATLLAAGKISPSDAQNIQAQADIAREGLNVARGMAAAGDVSSASSRLEVANAALKALQSYLLTKQQGVPR